VQEKPTPTPATGALTTYVAWVTTHRDAPPARHEFIADDPQAGLRALLSTMPRGSSATCRPKHRDKAENEIRLRPIDVSLIQRSDGKRIHKSVFAACTTDAIVDVIDQVGGDFTRVSATDVGSAGACTAEVSHG